MIHDFDRSQVYRVELNTDNQNDARIIALHFIEPGTKVLDVGCSCGDFGVLLQKERVLPGWENINQYLIKERKRALKGKIINFLIPINSNRRKIIVRLYHFIKVGSPCKR